MRRVVALPHVLYVLIETHSLSVWDNVTALNNKTQLTVTEIIAPMIQLYCCILVLSADRLTYEGNLLQQAPCGLSSHLTLLCRSVCVCAYTRVCIHYVSLCFCLCDCRLISIPLLYNSLDYFLVSSNLNLHIRH